MLYPLTGVGLRQPHYEEFIASKPDIGWIEVHSENYFCCGGPSFDYLLKIRENYPVSLHGVAMSLGSTDGLDMGYLKQLKELIDIIDPCFVSDHLSWSSHKNHFLPDLIPSPYTQESLQLFTDNINKAQDFLGREIMFENPSSYFEYNISSYQEADFMNLLAERTGAGILLDINNIYVSSFNHDWPVLEYLQVIKPQYVKELHLAGYTESHIGRNRKLLLDSHDNFVSPEVWDLYRKALIVFGGIPTLIEWDVNIPVLQVLLMEAKKADSYLQEDNCYTYVF